MNQISHKALIENLALTAQNLKADATDVIRQAMKKTAFTDAELLNILHSVASVLKEANLNCLPLPYPMGSRNQQRIVNVWKPASAAKKDLFFFEFAPAQAPTVAPTIETPAPAVQSVVKAPAPTAEASPAAKPKLNKKRKGKSVANSVNIATLVGEQVGAIVCNLTHLARSGGDKDLQEAIRDTQEVLVHMKQKELRFTGIQAGTEAARTLIVAQSRTLPKGKSAPVTFAFGKATISHGNAFGALAALRQNAGAYA